MSAQDRNLYLIPEEIDNGSTPSQALLRHIQDEEPVPEQVCISIARSLTRQEHLEETEQALRNVNPNAAARILLASCGGANNGTTTIEIRDHRRAADTLRRSAEQARSTIRRNVLLTAAEQLEKKRTKNPDLDPEKARNLRKQGRDMARSEDLSPLAHLNHAPETVAAAAETIHVTHRRADLLAHTYDPPEALCRALASHSHHNPHNPPAPLGRNHPAHIAARLHQASNLAGPISPHEARWLHARHPALWLTGHDNEPAHEAAALPQETTPQETIEALLLAPAGWFRIAATASRRSAATVADAAAYNLKDADQKTARHLAAEWTMSLEDLRRTATAIGRH